MPERISGRVEHVVSGETQEFRSLSDLLNSIGLLLRRDDSPPESNKGGCAQ